MKTKNKIKLLKVLYETQVSSENIYYQSLSEMYGRLVDELHKEVVPKRPPVDTSFLRGSSNELF